MAYYGGTMPNVQVVSGTPMQATVPLQGGAYQGTPVVVQSGQPAGGYGYGQGPTVVQGGGIPMTTAGYGTQAGGYGAAGYGAAGYGNTQPTITVVQPQPQYASQGGNGYGGGYGGRYGGYQSGYSSSRYPRRAISSAGYGGVGYENPGPIVEMPRRRHHHHHHHRRSRSWDPRYSRSRYDDY